MSSIEEDIKRCEQLTRPEHASWIGISNQLAILHVLEEHTRQKQINEEHKKINGELREKVKELEKENELILNSKIGVDLSYDDYVPKQEIKDIVFGSIHKGTVFKDEYIYPSDTCQYVVRRIVKELLQEEDK